MNRQTILIVDDAEMNRMMLIDMLGDQYNYVEASNGREALCILEKRLDIDLMLLDVNMPELNGFQVLEEMNRFHWIREVPVIMITAEESVESMEHAYDLGVTDYIPRPFNIYIVRRRVENTLNLYVNQKRLMKVVSDQIAEKEENNTIMVNILSNVVELRNHESGDHIRNIRNITELLLHQLVQKTQEYHLTEEDIALIKTASSLHDIGKITIPEEILNKPGKLTKEEFEIMKTHSAAGAHILEETNVGKDKPLYRYALEICRWHHERWDGHGYPDGLIGEQIPIAAQIVALADVYDALTSERCYKKAFDHETAIHMILNGECGAFNPLLLECLLDTAPQLRIATGRDADATPYRMDIKHLSDEILAHAEIQNNDRAQNILDLMQERVDFFASMNGGIQFEYDALSKLVNITNWNEPLQYRHSVKNVSHPDCFQSLSEADFKRLQEAMDATTRKTPEFSMSILFPCGDEFHWCDLRVRTLWSDRQPEHYIGAVGQMTDPQSAADKGELLLHDREKGASALLENVKLLKSVFDVVRLVDPTNLEVLELDEKGVLRHSDQHCAAFWGNAGACANCTSSRALQQKTSLNKLEFTSTDIYFVLSKYVNLNGNACVLAMLSKMSDGRWIDANGTRFLLDRSQGENMEFFIDPVTNAYSRRYFENYRAHLEGMECVMVIDADHFKKVNDTFGHIAGDAVLRSIASTIMDCTRKSDILIRYGGDEFLLLFPQIEEEEMQKKMQEIENAVNSIHLQDYPELQLSVSIGGVVGVHPIAEAIRKADLRMYQEKGKKEGPELRRT